MVAILVKKYLLIMAFVMAGTLILAQNKVPLGIHYQAVARNNSGNELMNEKISVRFSIISGDPLSVPVYQELHQDVITSKFGVFSLVIGHGLPTGNTQCTNLSEIAWDQANHFLKVEVKFENDFMDMGTMQFLAVPYALYAQKSLEPGPAGPKGDPGDPATDDQTLSFNGSTLSISEGNSVPLNNLIQTLSVVPGADGKYLSISGGNSVNITTAEADGDPVNEIQDLILNASNNTLTLSKSSAPAISLNDADSDPQNEIQDLQLSGDKLSVTGKTGANEINLGVYRDNTDNQILTYTESNNTLAISGGNSVTLGSMVAFRAKKLLTVTASSMTDVTFLPSTIEYNDGLSFNSLSGEFTATVMGIYTFNINYFADGSGGSRKLMIFLNSSWYEDLAVEIASGTLTSRSLTMKLNSGDHIKLMINTGTSTQTGTGSFSGYKVY
jgi:hypothetical protein